MTENPDAQPSRPPSSKGQGGDGSRAEALISTASGCTSFLRSYAEILADEPEYSERARQFSAMVREPGEILSGMDLMPFAPTSKKRIAFQAPCTLTHSLRLSDHITDILARLGHTLVPVADSHLCCGAAGTYALLQPEISWQLQERKLAALAREGPELIVSANIGCITQLQARSPVPVRHWLELLAEGMA